MQNNNKFKCILLSSLFLFFVGCATTKAPVGWLREVENLPSDIYGGWITIESASVSNANAELSGELIAIDKDSIYFANESFHAIAIPGIKSAQLETYESHAELAGSLSFLGTISTISNGFWLIFTAPMWIIGGSIATQARYLDPIIKYPKQDLSLFVPFCRFPQGLPAGIDRNNIKMKPVE